jgi:hypothetical protein
MCPTSGVKIELIPITIGVPFLIFFRPFVVPGNRP